MTELRIEEAADQQPFCDTEVALCRSEETVKKSLYSDARKQPLEDPMHHEDLLSLSREIVALISGIADEAADMVASWRPWLDGSDYAESAANLALYLALRHRDLRGLQARLMAAGLSSLGRSESRVMPTLHAIRHVLSLACGNEPPTLPHTIKEFFAGQSLIVTRANAVLGTSGAESPVRLMVTLPSGAAEDAKPQPRNFRPRMSESLGIERLLKLEGDPILTSKIREGFCVRNGWFERIRWG